MKPYRDHLRDQLSDLLLEYANLEDGATAFRHDLLVSCRDLEHYFSGRLHSVESIRISQ